MSSLAEALLEARKNMQMPPLNGVGHAGKGGSRTYKYATLQDVLKCVVPPLIEQGVLLSQGFLDGQLVTTVSKGEETMTLDSRRVNMSGTSQEQGSAETYAKRYALCSVFCIAGAEDDDGQAASSMTQPYANGGDIKAAKTRMWHAIQKWAELHGRTPEDVLDGVKKRPGWSETVEFFDAVTLDFEGDMDV